MSGGTCSSLLKSPFVAGSHPDADTVHHTNLVMQLCVALWGTLLEYQHETGRLSLHLHFRLIKTTINTEMYHVCRFYIKCLIFQM